MTVTTVYATAPGGTGSVTSTNATYSTARTGGTLGTGGNHQIGQSATYTCREAHVIWDTSGVGSGQTVSDVVLSMDGNIDNSNTDFNVIAATSAYDGGQVATTDWVDGSTLSALTQLASWATSGYSAGYNAFTSAGAAFNSAINITGNTSLILFSDAHAAGTTPTTLDLVTFDDADAAGTTTDPKLDITHAAAATATPTLAMMGVGT